MLALPNEVVEHLLRRGDIAQFRVRVVISRGVGSGRLRAIVLKGTQWEFGLDREQHRRYHPPYYRFPCQICRRRSLRLIQRPVFLIPMNVGSRGLLELGLHEGRGLGPRLQFLL